MASNVSEDPEYQRYWKASLEEAQKFPRSRENDHAIKLKPEAPTTLDCKVYPLNPLRRTAAAKLIKEHPDKKYIYLSKSVYTVPFFFVKHKEGSLRPVNDCRILNS
jgi:hypothetical protein